MSTEDEDLAGAYEVTAADVAEMNEVRGRREAVRFALASGRLEGLVVEPVTRRLLNAWASGRLSTADLEAAAGPGDVPNLVRRIAGHGV